MDNSCCDKRYFFRFSLGIFLIAIPVFLLIRGTYGSFLFSFSIPLIWQVAYLGKPISSLGFKVKSLGFSLLLGVLSGVVLGLLGGKLLELLGVAGFSFTDVHNIEVDIGLFKIKFSLAKELGYQLFSRSSGFKGLILYFLFNILLIGLGEEIFWRGFIQRKIGKRLKKSAAIGITALLFSLTHSYIFILLPLSKGIILLGLIGFVGAAWGYLYERIDNIWCPAISHGLVAAIIWKYYFFAF